MTAHRTIPERMVASFLGLMPSFGWCDVCDRRVLRDSLHHYDEGNVCEACYEKASY